MTIYIDADGCPVVAQTVELARKYQIPCVVLCDTSHEISLEGAQTVTVSKGADSVDFALVNRLAPEDLAVTQDYGLAAMCLARGARCIDQNGMVYDDGNITGLLTQRHAAGKLRRAGGRQKGPKKRRPEQDAAFAQALERLLHGAVERGEGNDSKAI